MAKRISTDKAPGAAKNCRIILDKLSLTYQPGEVINGTVEYQFDTPDKLKTMFLIILGKARVDTSMKLPISRRVSTESSVDLTEAGEQEEYFRFTFFLVNTGTAADKPVSVSPGTNVFPFTFTLPREIPASFVGKYGKVEYSIIVVLKRPWKIDEVTRMVFKVFVPFDFSSPQHTVPIDMELDGIELCFCTVFRNFKLEVSIPKSYFYTGQSIPVHINCSNNTPVSIKKLKIILMQKESYFSGTVETSAKKWRLRVAEVHTGPIKARSSRNWKELLIIPPLNTANLEHCDLINLVYDLKVICVLPLLFFDSGVKAPVYIVMETRTCRIVLDKLSGIYRPGEIVRGNVECQFETMDRIASLYIVILGDTRSDKRFANDSVKSHDGDKFLHVTHYLVNTGNCHDEAITTLPGLNNYPFMFRLPLDIPASFDGRYGRVKYSIIVTLKRPCKIDETTRSVFKVFAPFDFSTCQHRRPIEMEIKGMQGCFCMTYRCFAVKVTIPRSSYYVGQSIPVHINCSNNTPVRVKKFKIVLTQKETYFTGVNQSKVKRWSSKIAQVQTDSVKARSTRNWRELILIPPLNVANLDSCDLIRLEYEVTVICVLPLCFFNLKASETIYIGKAEDCSL